jgi:hypothetical protein
VPLARWKYAPLTCAGLPIPAAACVALPGFARSPFRDDELRVACKQGDWFEILQYIVLETIDGAVEYMRAQEPSAERVAIGGCASHMAHTNGPCCPRDVFDNDWLGQR